MVTSDRDTLSPAKRALLERALASRRQSAGSASSIPRRPAGAPVPLSSTQLRMWFLAQWEPDAPTFNAARAVRLRGELDPAALAAAIEHVIERHESLRTVVAPGPEPQQVVLDDWRFELPVIELASPAGAQALPELLTRLAREPFDLTAELMIRATLIRLAPRDHVLLLRVHHIAADAHSDTILFAEIAELYNARLEGRDPVLPALPVQYADYTLWQQARLDGPLSEQLVAYWRDQLAGAPPLLALPTDRPRPPVQRHAGCHRMLSLDRTLAEGLTELARPQGATFYMAALAAFATLLYRRTQAGDIVIGTPIANRNNVELRDVIGFFSNTVALRVRLGGSPTFRELLSRVRETALGAYAHSELPFERVVQTVAPKRDPSYNPLFQVNFRAQESERPALSLTGLDSESIHVDIGFSRFDLALELELKRDQLGGYFEYDEDLFDAATVDGLVDDLTTLLEQVLADPDAPILTLKLPARAGAPRAGAKISRRRGAT